MTNTIKLSKYLSKRRLRCIALSQTPPPTANHAPPQGRGNMTMVGRAASPVSIAQWAADWPRGHAAGRVTRAANRCRGNRYNPSHRLPAVPHEYDHRIGRGPACWEWHLNAAEIFTAFYSPVAVCLLECLTHTRWDSWNRWY